VPLEQTDEATQRAPVRDLVLVLRPDGHEPHDEAGLLLDLLPAMQPARHRCARVVATQGSWTALAVPQVSQLPATGSFRRGVSTTICELQAPSIAKPVVERQGEQVCRPLREAVRPACGLAGGFGHRRLLGRSTPSNAQKLLMLTQLVDIGRAQFRGSRTALALTGSCCQPPRAGQRCALGQGLRDAGDRLRLQGRREERQQRDDRADGALVHDRVDVLLCATGTLSCRAGLCAR